jgi:hypothetical protein
MPSKAKLVDTRYWFWGDGNEVRCGVSLSLRHSKPPEGPISRKGRSEGQENFLELEKCSSWRYGASAADFPDNVTQHNPSLSSRIPLSGDE